MSRDKSQAEDGVEPIKFLPKDSKKRKKKKPNKIKRTGDATLDALIRQIEAWRGKRITQKKPRHERVWNPKLQFIGLTHHIDRSETFASKYGGLMDNPFKPASQKSILFVETRVGSKTGTGIDHAVTYVPEKGGIRPLQEIANNLIKESTKDSAHNYFANVGESYRREQDIILNTLKEIKPTRSLYRPKQRRIPSEKLKQILKKCSAILNEDDDIYSGGVKARYIDEERRYVNSEGTVIKDGFYGIEINYNVIIRDSQGRRFEFSDRFTTRNSSNISVRSGIEKAKRLRAIALERVDCETLPPGDYDILMDPTPFSTAIHEAVVHTAASDSILELNSASFGIENYLRQVAPDKLTVYSEPNMKNRWGSMYFDYEGVPAIKKALIQDGVLTNYLADRHGAQSLNDLIKEHFEGKVEVDIYPGDSRVEMKTLDPDPVCHPPYPRTSNLSVIWNDSRNPQSREAMFKRFQNHLKRRKKPFGIYFSEIGTAGDNDPTDSTARVFGNAAYKFYRNGDIVPIKPVYVNVPAQSILRNIVCMGEPRKYLPGWCGHAPAGDEDESRRRRNESMDELDTAWVRHGILCGPAILNDLYLDIEKGPRWYH